MNHCHDCNSDYAAPGTCNCFAPGGKRLAVKQGSDATPWSPWIPCSGGRPDTVLTLPAITCANCGGVYIGSHVCGYYNASRGPHCTTEVRP